MLNIQVIGYSLAAALFSWYMLGWRRNPLHAIPTVGGFFAPGFSYLCGLSTMFQGKDLIEYGYAKYRGQSFKVPMLSGWLVVITNLEAIEDLKKRHEDEFSLTQGIMTVFPMHHVTGRELQENTWLHEVIQMRLTRNIGALLPDIMDELILAVEDCIPVKAEDWVSVHLSKAVQNIVVRVINRPFVGLPACRSREYLSSITDFAHSVVMGWFSAQFFPVLLALPVSIGKFFNGSPDAIRRATQYLKPLIDERRAMLESDGSSKPDAEVPNDLLQWCIEEGHARNCSDKQIVLRIMAANFGALHTTSMSLTNALYDLAAYPEYVEPLREEIAPLVAAEGWTKAAFGKMWKVDSFLKESHRYNGMSIFSMLRKATSDVTLADGTVIPKGTLVSAAPYAVHHDDTVYPHANAFDPFRFARLREQDGQSTQHQLFTTTPVWMGFGHGRHACPGRFFATSELRAILAHIIMNYDLKLEGGGTRPKNFFFSVGMVPPPNGRVLFKRRKVSD